MSVHPETDKLIEQLAREAQPVQPLARPGHRAVAWLGVTAAVGAAGILTFADMNVVERQVENVGTFLQMAGALATGILGVIAAFHLCLPDRSSRWAFLPLPALLVWLAASGMGCWRDWGSAAGNEFAIGQSAQCLVFIVGVGLPLGAVLLFALSRARPLFPVRTSIIGGLGAAALAAFFLEFFHPIAVTAMDLLLHAIAVVVVVAVLTRSRFVGGGF